MTSVLTWLFSTSSKESVPVASCDRRFLVLGGYTPSTGDGAPTKTPTTGSGGKRP